MNFIHAVQALADAGVEFAIIGGWSAILHGSAQVTNLGNWDDIKGTCVRLPAFGREVLTLDLGSLIRATRRWPTERFAGLARAGKPARVWRVGNAASFVPEQTSRSPREIWPMNARVPG